MSKEKQQLIAKGIALVYALGTQPDMYEKTAEVMVGLACQIGIDPALVTEEAASLLASLVAGRLMEGTAN